MWWHSIASYGAAQHAKPGTTHYQNSAAQCGAAWHVDIIAQGCIQPERSDGIVLSYPLTCPRCIVDVKQHGPKCGEYRTQKEMNFLD